MTTYPPFCSPEELAAWAQLPTDDPRLAGAVDSASAMIRAYCGWHVAPTVSETLLVDGPGGHVVTLPTMHVENVMAVTVVNPSAAATPYAALTSIDFEWSPLGELRRWPDVWTSLYRGLTVSLEHGYPTGSAAWAIAHSIVLSVASRAILSPASGVVREQTLVSSITYGQSSAGLSGGSGLAGSEMDALAPFKLRGV
jgi:hypothetical protein